MAVPVTYSDFFDLPASCSGPNACKAKCKECSQFYKFTKSSKGNLFKHIQNSQGQLIEMHREKKRQSVEGQSTLDSNGQLSRRARKDFKSQDVILTSLVRNLVGSGGLPLQVAEQEGFCRFMGDVEPRFQPASRVAIKQTLEVLYQEERDHMLKEVAASSFKPSVTLDFWTGRDGRSFMGCIVHYVSEKMLKHHMLFFKEVPPPHTSENIRNNFEDQFDHLNVTRVVVVTDNVANMKCVFHMAADDNDDTQEFDDSSSEMYEDDEDEFVESLGRLDSYFNSL